MDYKFIILLVVLLGLILFFTKELNSIRNDSDEKINKVIACVDSNSKLIRTNFKSELDGCINKIKTLNCDFVAQVRRMDNYESQPITALSNHYTDSDSNDKKRNMIPYLSDAYDNKLPKHDKEKAKESFYMSEDVPNPSDKKVQSAGQFKVAYTTKDQKDNNDKKNDGEKKSVSSSHSSKSSKSQKSDKHDLIEVDDNTVSSEESTDSESENSTSSEDSSSSSKKSSSKKTSSASLKKTTSSDSDSSALSLEVDQAVIKKTKEKAQKKPVVKPKPKQQKQKKNESSDSSDSSGTVHSSKYGSIKLGSKKETGVKISNKIGIKSKKKKQSSEDNNSSNENNSDGESVTTKDVNISALTIDELKPVGNYTLDYLKKVAKRFSIPLTLKDGDTRRQLKKEELYDKIKTNLIKKEK
jgi:hypothetical protein